MTTRLRFVGASIMGTLDPDLSPVSEEEGAWVRANPWTKGLRRVEDAYPRGFHRFCSREASTCHPCASGHHDQCISAGGSRVDEDAGNMTDRGGTGWEELRAARPGQPTIRPCSLPPWRQRSAPAAHPGRCSGARPIPAARRVRCRGGYARIRAGPLRFPAATAPASGQVGEPRTAPRSPPRTRAVDFPGAGSKGAPLRRAVG
ncbi:DUF6248 family natural product biosynthesis protein [Streptomyces phaeochromogenes]|uniref:DUF6248 family natural product biosynthesis protein n=1 Tax=Streptomyces phaeochromogenes TaxID=1923 RepID=UPI00367B5623